MSSYHRLIIHRAAQYFKVDHIVVDVEPGKRAVVLIKSPNCRMYHFPHSKCSNISLDPFFDFPT